VATLPVDPDIAARVNAANDRGRIRKEIAWSRPRPPAPKEMQSDWRPCSPSVPIADDLSIPDFLKREPAGTIFPVTAFAFGAPAKLAPSG